MLPRVPQTMPFVRCNFSCSPSCFFYAIQTLRGWSEAIFAIGWMPVEFSSSSDDEDLVRDMRQLHREILPEERRTAQRPQHDDGAQGPTPSARSNTVTFRQEIIEVRAGMWYHTRDASYKHLLKKPPPPSALLYDPIKRTTVLASTADVRRFYLYIADRQPEGAAMGTMNMTSESMRKGEKCHSCIPSASLLLRRKTRLDLRVATLCGLIHPSVYAAATSPVLQSTPGEFVKLKRSSMRIPSLAGPFTPDPFCIVRTDPLSRATRLIFPARHQRYATTTEEEGCTASGLGLGCPDDLLQGTLDREYSGVEVGLRIGSKQVYSLTVGKIGILQQGSIVVVDTCDVEPTATLYRLLLPRRSLAAAALSFVGLCTSTEYHEEEVSDAVVGSDRLASWNSTGILGTKVALVEERGIYEGVFGDRQLPLQLRVGFPRQRQVQCATYLEGAGKHANGANLFIGFASGDLMLHDPRHSPPRAGFSRPGMFAEWKGAFGGHKGAVQSLLRISEWNCTAAISDGSIHLIDLRRLTNDGYHIETVELYAPPIPLFSTRKVDCTSDGRLCAFGTCDGKVRVIELTSLRTVCDLDWPLVRSDGKDAVGQPVYETVMIHRQLSRKSDDSPLEKQLCLSLNASPGSRTGSVETLYCGEW